jgi:hypothetical protein
MILIALLAAVAYAGGSTLQSVAVGRRGPALFLVGSALDLVAWGLSLIALHGLPVYVVQAVLASSLAFTVVFARIWQHAALHGRDVAAIGALIPALAVIAVAGRSAATPVVSHATTTYLTVFGFAAAAAAALAVWRRTPVPAVLAGLSFSATALAARVVDLGTPLWQQPLVWVVAATGAAGTVAYAAALSRGPVGPATAQLWAVEVVVPAAVAIPLLGDGVRPGWLPAAAVAVLVVVAGTVVLARNTPSSAEARPSVASGTRPG